MAKIVGRRPIELKISDQLNGYIPVYNSSSRLWSTISKNDFITGSAITSGSNIFIGNQTISGSLTVTQGITGSLFGTASYADNAWAIGGNTFSGGDSSRILGTFSNHDLSVFVSGSKVATFTTLGSLVLTSGSIDVFEDSKLAVYAGTTTSHNLIKATSDIDGYSQISIQNTNSGSNASSNIVATADNGSNAGKFINMGINSSTFTGSIGSVNDAYLYSEGNNLHIGSISNSSVQLFAGGTNVNTNRKLLLNPNNLHQMTGSLDVSGSIVARSFTGSLQGSSSYALTSSYADNFTVAGTLTAQTIIAQTITSSTEFITGSTRNGSLLTNTHEFTGSVSVTGSLEVNGRNYINDSSSFAGRINTNSSSFASFSGSYVTESSSFASRITTNSASISSLSSSFTTFSGSYSTGSFTGSFIGSLTGTASYATQALSASYWSGSIINAATASYILQAQSASFATTASNANTASYVSLAQTASYVLNAVSASFAPTASSVNRLNQNVVISGSLTVTGSTNIIGDSGTTLLSSNADTLIFTGSLLASGSIILTGSLSILGSATGSLLGTASYAAQALTASNANTASSADNFTIRGTLTAQTIVAQTITSSTEFITGSTRNGSLSSNTHQFTGSVGITGSLGINGILSTTTDATIGATLSAGGFQNIKQFNGTSNFLGGTLAIGRQSAVNTGYSLDVSGSVLISGSVRSTNGFTGSFSGSLYNLQNSIVGHIPFFSSSQVLADSIATQLDNGSGSYSIAINQNNITTAAPEALYVYQPSATSYNVIAGKGNLNNYLQLNIQNTNTGVSASSDVVATANNGNETTNYIDMGINSEGFTGLVGDANDAYLYSTGNDLHIGNASNFPIQFFAGGLDNNANKKFQLNPNNSHQMTGSLDVSGSIVARSFTGSLQGTASVAVSSSYAVSASYAITASLAINANNAINASTASYVLQAQSSSYVLNAISASYAATASNAPSYLPLAGGTMTGDIYAAGRSFTLQDLLLGAGTTFGKLTTDGSKYISIMPTYNVESARFWPNGNVTIQDAGTYVDNGFRLDVSGSGRFTSGLTITGSLNTTEDATIRNAYIGLISAFGSDYTSFSHTSRKGTNDYSLLSDNAGITYLNAKSGSDLRFRVDNIDKVVIDSNGNLGVNKISPNAKFDVDGNSIITGSLVVTNGITSSLFGTASYAATASFVSGISDGTASLANTASYAISASYAATASSANDFLVRGTLTAQTINVQTITSSIDFVTGSTRFGSTTDNTHQFTGSVSISGSLGINGVDYNSTSASFDTRILNNSGSIAQLSGSYLASSASFDTRITNNSASIAQLSGSYLASSASFDTRINVISSSYATTGSNIFVGNQIITGSFAVSGSTTQVGNNNLLGNTTLSGSIIISGSVNAKADLNLGGVLRFDPAIDPGTSNLTASYLFTSASNTATGHDLYYRQNENLVKFKWIEGGISSGLLYGGVVSYSGSNIYVSKGSGIITDLNASTGSEISPILKYITWNDFTGSATYLTSSQHTFLYVDDTNTVRQQPTYFNPDQFKEAIPLGRVTHANYASITGAGSNVQTTYDSDAQQNEFIRIFGPIKESGLLLSAQTGSMRLSIGAGQAYNLGGFYPQDPNHPSHYISGGFPTASIARAYRSGSAIYLDNNNGAFYTTVDSTNWDDGTGVLNSMASSEWQIQRVFVNPVTGRTVVYYGQATYTTLLNAQQSLATDQFEEGEFTAKSLIFVGYLIIKGNTTNLADTGDNSIIQSGIFRGTQGSSGGSIISTTLDSLSDVVISTPSNGQALIYNGGVWVNGNPASASYAATASFVSGISDGTASFANTASNAISSSYAATASSADNFTVRGTLTAQTIVAQTITSSIEFITGSTRNGSLLTNTHQFTGSVGITGSLTVAGNILPSADAIYNLGTSGARFNTIYSSLGVINILYSSTIRATTNTVLFGSNQTNFWGGFIGTSSTSSANLILTYTTSSAGIVDNGYKLQIQQSGSVSGSLFVSGSSVFNGTATIVSASLDYQQNLAVATGSFQTIVSAATGSFRSAFFDYVAFSGSIVRAGTVVSTWSGSNTEFYENFTGDLGGSTAVVTLQTAISASNIVLQAGISGSAWSVRSLVRLL